MSGLDDLKEGRVAIKQNIDQYSRFLKPTIPEGQLNYYNPRLPLVSKEVSVGNIQREDMLGHVTMVNGINQLMEYGQIGLARHFMTAFQSEIKLTMSFEGKLLSQIGSNKFEYTQEQHVHEHREPEPQARRGLLAGLRR